MQTDVRGRAAGFASRSEHALAVATEMMQALSAVAVAPGSVFNTVVLLHCPHNADSARGDGCSQRRCHAGRTGEVRVRLELYSHLQRSPLCGTNVN
jgi:hypothetical protein